jgi:ABC-type tungstate transport system substrate-binding protein
MWESSAPLMTREIQIKTTLKISFTLITMAAIKITKTRKILASISFRNQEHLGLLVGVWISLPAVEFSMEVPPQTKTELP